MDFEDSGIESDPKVNSDTDTLNQNEPIISFSPERCRFDSGQTSSRKSSTTFPISVTDLEDSIASGLNQSTNANNCNSITNLQNSASTVVPNKISIHHKQQPFFTNVQNQPYPFLSHQASNVPTPSSSSSIVPSGAVINTHSIATLSPTASSNNNPTTRPLLLPSTTSSSTVADSNSMVNGAVLITNNSALDLQKRLEKRIAQASTTSPLPATNTNSLLPDISTTSSGASDSINENGNQISFSPTTVVPPTSTSIWESSSDLDLWDSKMAPEESTSVGKGFNLDGEKTSKVTIDEFMMDSQSNPVHQLDTTVNPSTRDLSSTGKQIKNEDANETGFTTNLVISTTCTSVNTTTSGSSPANVNKSSSKNNKSLRNNAANNSNNASNTPSVTNFQTASTSSALPSASVITAVNSGFDIRKVSGLLPPQRLAIPTKPNPQLQSSHMANNNSKTATGSLSSSTGAAASTSNNCTGTTVTFSASPFSNPCPATTTCSVYGLPTSTTTTVQKTSTRNASILESSCNNSSSMTTSGNGNVKAGSNSSKLSSEKKPLVQWDSDESEEELSFFPPAKRGVITDNLSIDNMSLSGEEEDLHLTPPRPLSKKCPCDPRSWLDRSDISSHHHGDPTHSISSKQCIIS